MKKLFTILSLPILSFVFGQDNSLNAPTHLEARVNSNQFEDQVAAYEAYWENRDPNKRGSGFKQFQRWKQLWKYEVKEDGTLPTAQELAQSWLNLLNIQQNKFNESEEHTSELQSRENLVCRLLLEKKINHLP